MRWATEKRRMWEDRREYLEGSAGVLGRLSSRPLIVAGDFNRRIGQGHAVPADLRTALEQAMPPGMTIATSAVGLRGLRSIDHIAISGDLAAESTGVIDNRAAETVGSLRCLRLSVGKGASLARR